MFPASNTLSIAAEAEFGRIYQCSFEK